MNSSSKALRREDAEARFDSAARARDTQARPDPTPVTVQVWDPALRAFHWSLAASVSVALVSGEIGGPWIEWHGRAGEAIAGLLAFRLAWGLIGTGVAILAVALASGRLLPEASASAATPTAATTPSSPAAPAQAPARPAW